MKHPIPHFLRADYQIPEANIRSKAERDMDKLLKVTKGSGYLEAVADLRRGLKTTHPALLVLIEPAVRNLLLKADYYSELAK